MSETNSSFSSLQHLPELHRAMLLSADYHRFGQPLPPLLAVLPTSVELEPLIGELCCELEAEKLVEFTGDKPWLSIRLDSPEISGFPSFERMLDTMLRFSGYRNSFGGVVMIDATAWMPFPYDERMDALFAYIHDYSDEIFFIVCLSTNDPSRALPFKSAMSRWVHTAIADIAPPEPDKLISLAEQKLKASGRSVSPSGHELIASAVHSIAAHSDFAGLREIDSLVCSIISSTDGHSEISATQLSDFSPGGSWSRLHGDIIKTGIGF